jgi:hypothetical protein
MAPAAWRADRVKTAVIMRFGGDDRNSSFINVHGVMSLREPANGCLRSKTHLGHGPGLRESANVPREVRWLRFPKHDQAMYNFGPTSAITYYATGGHEGDIPAVFLRNFTGDLGIALSTEPQ